MTRPLLPFVTRCMSASDKYVGKVYDQWISSYEGAQLKGAHAKPATVIASTARYDEICGGAGLSVTVIDT